MYNGKTIIGLIPARGGSKGLPRKNLRPLHGKPLIAWTIDAALSSRSIDRVVVSTEDEEISEVSKTYGADVPFMRPSELATDEASSIGVVFHAIETLKASDSHYDYVILLQPTSPLRTVEDIDRAIEFSFSINAGAVVSVCETGHHPYWANTLPADRNMKDFLRPEIANKNRQELPVFYRLNGAIYIASSAYLKLNSGFMNSDTYAYIMPLERSVDIDTELDLKFAEYLLLRA